MQLTTVKELFKERDKYLNQEIQVGGWIRSIRDSKAFGFIVLNDGTSFDTLQIVYHDTMANFAEVSKLNVGAAIVVKGTLVATPEAKQPFEIQASEISVEGPSTPDFPIQPKRHSMEFLRTLPHLRPTIAANVILVLNGALRVYDIPRLLTMGGPVLSSETQALYMYKMAFTSMRYGYGSAVAMFIVAEALFLALVVKKLLKTEE